MANRESTGLLVMTLVFMAIMGAVGTYFLTQVLPADAADTVDDLLSRGRMNANTGDFAAAIDDLTAAIDLAPAPADAYVARAETLIRIGDVAPAIADYTAALDRTPSLRAYVGRARAREIAGDVEAAIDDYTSALALRPGAASTLRARGRARRMIGAFDDAVVDVARAWELSPRLRGIDNDLAWGQWGVGDYHGALVSFERAVRRQPNALHHSFGRGATLYHLDRIEDAETELARAAGTPGSGRIYASFYLWLARVRLHGRAAADEGLHAYIEQAGAKVAAWPARIAAFLLGDLSEAELMADAAAGTWQPAPEQICEAAFYAGSLRLLQGDDDAAIALFNRSIETGLRNYYEYYSARAELAALGATRDR